MRLHLYVCRRDLTHTCFTLFVNRANCGQLTMMNDEFDQYVNWLSLGKRENELEVSIRDDVDWEPGRHNEC